MLLRTTILGAAAALALAAAAATPSLAASSPIGPLDLTQAAEAEMYKTAGCACCGGWMAHAREHGLEAVVHDVDMGEMARIKAEAGITPELASCHTTLIDGYVVEGHVPAGDIARLLAERPDALGIAVPGMPAGSPGMGEAGAGTFDVLLVLRDGRTEVFATH